MLFSELSSESLMHDSHSYLEQPTMAFLAVSSRLKAKKEQLPSDVASESLPALSQTGGPSGGPSDDESLPSITEHDSLPGHDSLPSSAEHESLPSGGPFSSISPDEHNNHFLPLKTIERGGASISILPEFSPKNNSFRLLCFVKKVLRNLRYLGEKKQQNFL